MRNIVLIGFMGCGKSTIGIKLSYKLHMTVEDTDKWIEKKEGKSITDIFAENGEAYFRGVETQCMKALTDQPGCHIISTGGGMPLREENRPLLKKMGHVIYLKAEPETIWGRLSGDTTRPLLQCENPQKKIQTLLAERNPIYTEAADSVIEVDGKDTDTIIEEILKEHAACRVIGKEENK